LAGEEVGDGEEMGVGDVIDVDVVLEIGAGPEDERCLTQSNEGVYGWYDNCVRGSKDGC
jgi:hypothetical protein